jgi:enoyl-CoA hydratase/carnithine racemase
MSSSSAESGLLVERRDGICRLTLHRPECRNALSRELLQQLDDAFVRIAADAEVRVVVLAAAGPVFCSGHDLKELAVLDAAQAEALFALCARMMQRMREIPQPVIARVHGVATAAGCQLVAACDLAVASSHATFATPGVKIGLFCTTPMVPLVRCVPHRLALEMLLTGEPISADRALSAGLVNRVVPPEELDTAVDELCAAIRRSSFHVVRLGKRAFYEQRHLPEPTAYSAAVEVMTDNLQYADAREGIAAFLEKRPPEWCSG